jgi:hypothetical protein
VSQRAIFPYVTIAVVGSETQASHAPLKLESVSASGVADGLADGLSDDEDGFADDEDGFADDEDGLADGTYVAASALVSTRSMTLMSKRM